MFAVPQMFWGGICACTSWLNSLIAELVVTAQFIVYFLSLHAGLALLIKARLEIVLVVSYRHCTQLHRQSNGDELPSAECRGKPRAGSPIRINSGVY
jgi:hypothetical protein